MNTPLPPPQRKVSLRLGNGASETRAMPPESLETLLAALRMRDDVPTLLYASAASVLAAVYDAAEE